MRLELQAEEFHQPSHLAGGLVAEVLVAHCQRRIGAGVHPRGDVLAPRPGDFVAMVRRPVQRAVRREDLVDGRVDGGSVEVGPADRHLARVAHHIDGPVVGVEVEGRDPGDRGLQGVGLDEHRRVGRGGADSAEIGLARAPFGFDRPHGGRRADDVPPQPLDMLATGEIGQVGEGDRARPVVQVVGDQHPQEGVAGPRETGEEKQCGHVNRPSVY